MKRFDADALWTLPRVASPVLSNDGGTIAVAISRFDPADARTSSQLHLLPTAGGELRKLTAGKGRDGSPAWSPDGKRLAFVRRLEDAEPAQLFVIPIDGGEAEAVTQLPVGVSSPQWHPDGQRILFVATVPTAARTWDEVKSTLEDRKAKKVSARVTEDRMYRFWSRWLQPGDFPHIFQVTLATREVVDLTPGMQRHFDLMEATGDFDIAPDGGSLLFSALKTPAPFEGPLVHGIYRLELGAGGAVGEPVELTESAEGSFAHPRFSPAGDRFAFGWREDPLFYADLVRLGIWELASGKHQLLTDGWDRSADSWGFDKAVEQLVFLAEDGHSTSLFSTSARVPLAAGEQPRRLLAGGTVGAPQLAPDGTVVFSFNDLSHPPEVAALRPGAAALERLTSVACDLLAEYAFGATREEHFAGAEGAEIGMLIAEPPDFAARAQWPLVHLVHGGPHGQFGDSWHWRWNPHVFASFGCLVAMVNFHGSTGRGAAFTRSILAEHPIKPCADVLAGTDHLIATGRVDERRMAVTGGSYGGFLVTWIGGHTDRFRCIVNHAGVIDLMAQMGSDVTHGRLLAYGGEPWNDLAAIERHSPARFSNGMNTPMLVIHGEQDYRVPIGNALEIYGILKAKGIPARLVYYPDENHWILKPHNSIHWYQEVQAWLARWLEL